MKKTVVTYFCDRCGEPLESDRWKISPKSYDRTGKEMLNELLLQHVDRDYCERCAMEIMAVACAPIRRTEMVMATKEDVMPHPKEEKEKSEEKQKRKYSRRLENTRQLDDGRIYALRNAGWDWEKIREDLRVECTIKTLQNHYEKEKARRETMKLEDQGDAYSWMDDIDDEEILDGGFEG
jgi:hypothetical protein